MLVLPKEGEYSSFYGRYISRVADGDIVAILKEQLQSTVALLGQVSEEKSTFRYESEKWSIRELVGHMCDTERIMAFRLLHVIRGDKTELPGFEEEEYVRGAMFHDTPLANLVLHFITTREATLSLLEFLKETATEEAWVRESVVNGTPVSARAFAFIIAGHELHHRAVLEEQYLARL